MKMTLVISGGEWKGSDWPLITIPLFCPLPAPLPPQNEVGCREGTTGWSPGRRKLGEEDVAVTSPYGQLIAAIVVANGWVGDPSLLLTSLTSFPQWYPLQGGQGQVHLRLEWLSLLSDTEKLDQVSCSGTRRQTGVTFGDRRMRCDPGALLPGPTVEPGHHFSTRAPISCHPCCLLGSGPGSSCEFGW